MHTTNMTRRAFVGTLGAASLTLAACGGSSDGGSEAAPFDGKVTGSITAHVQGYDWGCGVDKITLVLDQALDAIDVDSLTVTEHKQTTDWTAEDFPVIEADFPRTITAAAVDGTNVTLDLACDPNNGSPFLYTMATGYNTWCDPYDLNIAIAEGAELTVGGEAVTALEISAKPSEMVLQCFEQGWNTDSMETKAGTTYQYAYWDPEEESKNLVVWLHGAGEGGTEATDPTVTILANRVVALSEDDFQGTVGGAHVVAPQSPTMWMDIDGNSTYIDAEISEYVRDTFEFSVGYSNKEFPYVEGAISFMIPQKNSYLLPFAHRPDNIISGGKTNAERDPESYAVRGDYGPSYKAIILAGELTLSYPFGMNNAFLILSGKLHQDGVTKHTLDPSDDGGFWEYEYDVTLGLERFNMNGRSIAVELIWHDGRFPLLNYYWKRTKSVSLVFSVN